MLDESQSSSYLDSKSDRVTFIKKKRERRSKEDFSDRNFVCGCNKQYLSYAALYTHCKTKHNGIFPNGTTKLFKKRQFKQRNIIEEENDQLQRLKDFYKDYQCFVQIILVNENTGNQNISLQEFLQPKFLMNDQDEEVFKAYIIQVDNQLKKKHSPNYHQNIVQIICNEYSNKNLTVIDAFSLFVISVYQYGNKLFSQEVFILVLSYSKVMNDYGFDYLKEVLFSYEVYKQKFIHIQNCEIVPDLSNRLILEELPRVYKQQKVNTIYLNYFGLEQIKLFRTILFIKNFCQWLRINNFTKAKLEIQRDNLNQFSFYFYWTI